MKDSRQILESFGLDKQAAGRSYQYNECLFDSQMLFSIIVRGVLIYGKWLLHIISKTANFVQDKLQVYQKEWYIEVWCR